ncbi:hypothetical protein VNO78_01354 [Psophocarpus tetragonolobus]|uniref:Uncharacterized protein n=1 Tax=Psophocarpus tetragonolobus TaxID=3891 RepID=A0AAN9T1J3_PSOTE
MLSLVTTQTEWERVNSLSRDIGLGYYCFSFTTGHFTFEIVLNFSSKSIEAIVGDGNDDNIDKRGGSIKHMTLMIFFSALRFSSHRNASNSFYLFSATLIDALDPSLAPSASPLVSKPHGGSPLLASN